MIRFSRIRVFGQWRCFAAIAIVLLSSNYLLAQATDQDLLAFTQGRASQPRITQVPTWIDHYVAELCRAPTIAPRDSASPHWQQAVHVYSDSNSVAPMWDPYMKFEAGSILLKEKFAPDHPDQIELFTGMLKREPGFAPEVGDWEFFTIDGEATQVTSRGKLTSCIDSHRDYADSDFVTKSYAACASSAFRPEYRDAVWVDGQWTNRQVPVCNGSGSTVYLPASLAVTRGQKMTRSEATTAWWQSQELSPSKAKTEPAKTVPEDLSPLGGPKLRYEPQLEKNTLGYWTEINDSASWQIAFDKPGLYLVSVLQGCGQGSGGAVVSVSLAEQKLEFTVVDTGGFQKFQWREIGELEVAKAGQMELVVKPKTKPGVAVMDLQQIRLQRVDRP